MSSISVRPVKTAGDRRTFRRLPERLYRDDPHWVCPLRMERRDFFDQAKNPFFADAEVELFLAEHDGRAVGRISAHIYPAHNRTHNEKTGFFGFFDCELEYDIAATLWDSARAWLAQRGMKRMRGPANFTTNHEAGMLIDGFDRPPMIMMPYNPSKYPEFAERYGFAKAMDLYAYLAQDSTPLPERVVRIVERIRARSGVVVRPIRMRQFDEEVRTIKAIYDAAWAPNWGFVPMTEEEFFHMAKDLKMIVDPRIVLVATVDGRPVGFSLALPDINQVLIRLHGRLFPFGLLKLVWWTKIQRRIDQMRVLAMGILPEYHGRGIDQLLHFETRQRGVAAGYHTAELSWVLETNTLMKAVSESLGHSRYKTYRIYDLPLP